MGFARFSICLYICFSNLYQRPNHLYFRCITNQGSSFLGSRVNVTRIFFYFLRILFNWDWFLNQFICLVKILHRLRFRFFFSIFRFMTNSIHFYLYNLCLVSAFSPIRCESFCSSSNDPRTTRFVFGSISRQQINRRVVNNRDCEEGGVHTSCICFLTVSFQYRFRALRLFAITRDHTCIHLHMNIKGKRIFRTFVNRLRVNFRQGAARLTRGRFQRIRTVVCLDGRRFNFIRLRFSAWSINFNDRPFFCRLICIQVRFLCRLWGVLYRFFLVSR